MDKDIFNDELMTLREAANFLKVTPKALYDWRKQGKIKFVKIAGTLTRIKKSAVLPLAKEF